MKVKSSKQDWRSALRSLGIGGLGFGLLRFGVLGLGFMVILGVIYGNYPSIMENQMEEKLENEKETGIIC